MREIKFRAWHITSGMATFTMNDLYNFEAEGARKSYVCFPDGDIHKLDDVEVMQFTGMSDKNGKEIYEGDILGWMWGGVGQGDGTPAKSEVYFDRYKFAVRTGRTSFGWKLSQAAEVIGNIHENPELLEDK